MQIKILGLGSCSKCHNLRKLVDEAVQDLKIQATVEDVRDMAQILKYPMLAAPGLVINEELICSGRVPTKNEIAEMISTALKKNLPGTN